MLSRDIVYSPDDLVIARIPSPPVAASDGTLFGTSVRVYGTAAVPAGIAPGWWVVLTVPDVDNVAGLPPELRRYYSNTYVEVRGAVSADETAAAGVSLGVPRPNPTAGAARLAFTLGETGPVRLTLHDALGREVRVLASGTLSAGPHEAAVPAGLPPGVYVVRLPAGPDSRTTRLTVVR